MQTTKKLLLSILILSSRMNATIDSNEIPGGFGPKDKTPTVYQEVGSALIKEAFALSVPSDHTFNSARQAFEKFIEEKTTNTICLTAKQFFGNEADYFNALGAYAEAQKFPFLASLFYLQASENDAIDKLDLSEQIRKIGVSTVACMLNKLDTQSGFIQNPKDLFTKKDPKSGKTPTELAGDVFKLVGSGFKDRADFMKAVYDYQKHNNRGNITITQLFGDSFIHVK